MALAPAGQGMQAIDFKANRATVTSAELGRYRIVHMATHGVLDTEHPELSGLVLSLVDEHGKPQDGFLRLHEIYNLDWSADLVVLSACQTALGKEIRGEGLVGLTRGFMYAGAKSVLASLWNVNDSVTAQMMKRFYDGMFAKGLSPAAALRAAQLEMWKRSRERAVLLGCLRPAGRVAVTTWIRSRWPDAAEPKASDGRRPRLSAREVSEG